MAKTAAKKSVAMKPAAQKPPSLPDDGSAIVQGVFATGDAAVGLATLRAGFGLTPKDDRLFALGFPHLVYLVQGDASEQELAVAKKFSAKYGFTSGEIKAGVAPRMIRHVQTYRGDDKKWLAAIQNPDPLSDREAEQAAAFAITEGFGTMVVFLLEAQRSPSWVLEHVLAAYEATKWGKTPGLEPFGQGALRALHYVMLRVTAAEAMAARARLAALAKIAVKTAKEFDRTVSFLTTLLDPTTSDEIGDLAMRTPGDAKLIRDKVIAYLADKKQDYTNPDARHAFLGGDEVTKAYAKYAKRFVVSQRAELVDQFARVAHPSVADLMSAIANGRAKKWLAARG